jgi:hypothetical protein
MIRLLAIVGGSLTVASAVCALAAPASADTNQYTRTTSGKVRCLVTDNDAGHGGGPAVACEYSAGFPQAPIGPAGAPDAIASVHANGAFSWVDGNIGGGGEPENDLILRYGQTYHIAGWTVFPTSAGTTFTNDATSHGMFVSVQDVHSF